jgi:hypothetical protein
MAWHQLVEKERHLCLALCHLCLVPQRFCDEGCNVNAVFNSTLFTSKCRAPQMGRNAFTLAQRGIRQRNEHRFRPTLLGIPVFDFPPPPPTMNVEGDITARAVAG